MLMSSTSTHNRSVSLYLPLICTCGTPLSFTVIMITIYILYQKSVAAHSTVTGVLVWVHGWLMCLAWGFLIPVGVVIACFRTVRSMGTWWFHLAQSPTDSGVPGQPCWAVNGGLP